MSQKPKLWTRNYTAILSANFFIFLTFYLLIVTLTVYTKERFHTSQSLAGLASSIFMFGAVLTRPIAGKTIDRIGRKKMLLISLIFFVIGCVLYFTVTSLPMLMVNRFIHGVAYGFAATATASIAAEIVPLERVGEGMGYFATSMNLAMALGPFIGLFVTQYFSANSIFITATVFAIVALLAAMSLSVPQRERKAKQPAAKTGIKFTDFFEKAATPISLLMGVAGITYSSVLTFLTGYAQEIHVVSAASYFFVMYAGFLLASRPFTGKWFDKYGENAVIYPSLTLYAIGMIFLSQIHLGMMLLIAGALLGVGYGTFQSSTQAIAVKKAPRHRVPLATSTYFTIYDLGIGVGPFLLGFVIPFTGYRGLYVTMAIITCVIMFLYHMIHGKHASKRHEVDKDKVRVSI